MKNKITLGAIVVLLSLFLISIINAQISEYPQITEQTCSACTYCEEGLTCINFPGIGSRCAEPNPCSYYQCSPNNECDISMAMIAQVCPDGRNMGAVPRINCPCVGSDCLPLSDGSVITPDGVIIDDRSGGASVGDNGAPGGEEGARPYLKPIPDKPNIIVIMTDDQEDGLTMQHMYNVRKLLIEQGTTFVQSFVDNSLCCPSRATFLTGQCSHNNGVFFIGDNIKFNNKIYHGGYVTLEPTANNTLPVWLQEAGYKTAMIGKYVNGYGWQTSGEVIPPGWDRWFARVETKGLVYYDYDINDDGVMKHYGNSESDYVTDVYFNKAISFINNQVDSDQPFFISINPIAPHTVVDWGEENEDAMITPPVPAPRHEGFFSNFKLPKGPSFNEKDVSDKPIFMNDPTNPLMSLEDILGVENLYRKRLESLLSVDEGVKKVIDILGKIGKLDNTIIIYTSDNGFFHGEHRRTHGKRLVYDESVRVPFIIRGPGIRKDEDRFELITNTDLPATIIDLAGAQSGRILDGRSIVPLLTDGATTWRTGLLLQSSNKLAFLPHNDTTLYGIYQAIRTQSYLYAEHENASGEIEVEFYDMLTDPWQTGSQHDSSRYSKVVLGLSKMLGTLKDCQGNTCWVTVSEPSHPGVEPDGIGRVEPPGVEPPSGIIYVEGKPITYINNTKSEVTKKRASQILILPEDAIKVSETPNTTREVELNKELGQTVSYYVRGTKPVKFLALFSINLKIETKVNAKTGEVILVNKPWWSFLTW